MASDPQRRLSLGVRLYVCVCSGSLLDAAGCNASPTASSSRQIHEETIMFERKILISALMTAVAACSAPQSPATKKESPAMTTETSGITAEEHARTIAAMKPPKRARPVIAVVAENDGTETTDFIVPYAVLAASGAADVFAVAPEKRAIKMVPALSIAPQLTIAEFKARYAEGADYLIVPKIEKTAAPSVVSWIQEAAQDGTIIVGVCSGVKTVAAAGLLENRAATGHWFDLEGLRKEHPTMQWVRDRRYVADRGVVTTTGVSASMPVSLALVEAIAGRDRAASLARELGIERWDEQHDSAAFFLDATSKRAAQENQTSKEKELYALPVAPGVDDISLSFTTDSWSRTFRSKAITVASEITITTRYGLELLPEAQGTAPGATLLPAPETTQTGKALPNTLRAIEERYGEGTARFVALQLEYPWAR
jgi:putative intracellular protease/amidase